MDCNNGCQTNVGGSSIYTLEKFCVWDAVSRPWKGFFPTTCSLAQSSSRCRHLVPYVMWVAPTHGPPGHFVEAVFRLADVMEGPGAAMPCMLAMFANDPALAAASSEGARGAPATLGCRLNIWL